MQFDNFTKKQLVNLINNIRSIINLIDIPDYNTIQNNNDNIVVHQGTYTKGPKLFESTNTADKSDLENLIGSIPFLLQDKQLFETNQDIADFASKLDIIIPSPTKKKREDIIGRLISSIALFDSEKIKELNIVINSIKKADIKSNKKKKDKSSFFSEWDAAIKQMKI